MTITVPSEWAGLAVRDVLRRRLKVSRILARRLWSRQGVRLDGGTAEPFAAVQAGQILTLALPSAGMVAPEPLPLTVIHEDDDVVVIDKCAGMVAHPTMGVTSGTLAAALAHRYGGFHLVNRLDAETSGLVLVARHALAAQRLAAAISRREAARTYRAVVHDWPAEPTGRIEAPIARVAGAARRAVSPEGKAAITHYRVVGRSNGFAVVELALETGRTHQIRVHLAHIGHPVAGDDRYGPERRAWPRLCLHAAALSFPHPRTGARLTLESAWPADLPAIGIQA